LLNVWYGSHAVPCAVPMAWMKLQDRIFNCYLFFTDVSGHTSKNI
jgi:hypothetical protein